MIRTPSSFLLLLFSLNVLAQQEFIKHEFLQGQWSLEKVLRVEQVMLEEYYPRLPDDNIWVFDDDTCTRYHYPFALIEQSTFTIDSGRFVYSGWKFGFASLRSDSGKLVAHMNDAILIFRRDTLSISVVNCLNILQRDTINPGLMIAKYYMVTHFVPDDEEAYDFKPPIKMQNKFTVKDSAEARELYHTEIIYLKAGGKKRPFHVLSVDWEFAIAYYGKNSELVPVPVIRIEPEEWWTGEPFSVEFRANEIEVAKKQR